jgi:hypothetical protein
MQGFSLEKPFKLKNKVALPPHHREMVIERIDREPSMWVYADVYAHVLPESFSHINQSVLRELNDTDSCREWREPVLESAIDMTYGRGSIGTHVDEMTGITLLVLLFCEPWVQENFHPTYQGYDGEFISESSVITMEVGDAMVFDDRKPHAWLTNSAWAFAVFPLIIQNKVS